ncbi:MAG: hypothetical protein ACFFEY_10575 [Candidatus Thorarchaeota archaeon]
MSKKVDVSYLIGVFLFSFGCFSFIYVFTVVIINLSAGYTGILLRAKDITFDALFIFLGVLLIRNKKIISKTKSA